MFIIKDLNLEGCWEIGDSGTWEFWGIFVEILGQVGF